jgi:hypothetical protein
MLVRLAGLKLQRAMRVMTLCAVLLLDWGHVLFCSGTLSTTKPKPCCLDWLEGLGRAA